MENTNQITTVKTVPETTVKPKLKPLFKCTLPETVKHKKLLQLLAVLGDEVTWAVTESGLSAIFMDPSRVGMLQVNLPKEIFEEYYLENAKKYEFTFSIEAALKRVFKNVYKDERCEIIVPETSKVDYIDFILKQSFPRTFKQPLLEDSKEKIPLPRLHPTHKAKIKLQALKTAFKDFNDHVKVTMDLEKGVTFTSIDDYGENGAFFAKGNEEVLLGLEGEQKEAVAKYSCTYLQELFDKLSEISDTVEWSIATDMPLTIKAKYNSTTEERFSLRSYGNKNYTPPAGEITFWLAPRVETDEEPRIDTE